jgi:ParB family chromosome partitioning protein
MVPLHRIDGSPYQNRSPVPARQVEALAADIRRHGLNNPVIVRPTQGGRYQLVAGENRVAACRLNQETHIPAFVRSLDDGQSARTLVLDNFHHGDLSDYEIYKGLLTLKRVIQEDGLCGSLSEVAELTPWGKSQIHRLLSFAKLPQAALDALEANPGALGSQAASDLARLFESGTDERTLVDAVRRILSGELEQGRAAEWAAGMAGQAKPGKAEEKDSKRLRLPSLRTVRAVTAEGGRLVCTIERTPQGFVVKGAKGVDWAGLEEGLAEWLSSNIDRAAGIE